MPPAEPTVAEGASADASADGDAAPASSGGYIDPVNAPITSGFGGRMHPVLGYFKGHNGVDFGASCGTPVKAAKAGTVVAVEYNSASGNRVKVDHGNGVITGYSARIDPAGVGRALDAYIDVRLLPTTDSGEFDRRVARLDSVREVAFLTGRFDFQLRVACRDADDLNATVRAIRRDAGAAGTETRIVLRSTTFDRAPVG